MIQSRLILIVQIHAPELLTWRHSASQRYVLRSSPDDTPINSLNREYRPYAPQSAANADAFNIPKSIDADRPLLHVLGQLEQVRPFNPRQNTTSQAWRHPPSVHQNQYVTDRPFSQF